MAIINIFTALHKTGKDNIAQNPQIYKVKCAYLEKSYKLTKYYVNIIM